MTVRQLIPRGLAEMAPGPGLSALLAGIDIHAVTGSDAVEVLRARARQLSHEQARLLATMVEVGLCDPDAGNDEVARLRESPPYAGDEIRAALTWTRRAADRELDFAETLVLRMPAVFTALEAGRIDRNKAWVFADLCSDLTPEQAHVVCERLLPHAGRLTTGELAARIKKLAIALDPGWAARRYADAVRERNVIGYLEPDGTATVSGTGLPVEQAASACERVEELARAAKRAGHPGRIGPLRADIYLGLLDGRWQHHSRDQIIADLLASAASAASDTAGDASADHPDQTSPGTGSESPAGETRGDAPAAQDLAEDGPPTADEADAAPLARRVGVEVRVGVGTLLGRDKHPGEVPGWGPIPAEIARTMVAAQRAATWRYAITDLAGRLLLAGITRRRPDHAAPAPTTSGLPPCRDGIVELQIPAALLTGLAADPGACGPWSGIVADLAEQYTRFLQHGWRGFESQDPAARFAGAALRRHVQVRDRCCVHPGCRASAASADLDHTVNHSHGGATTELNTGPLCEHDHQLKTAGGWQLHQPDPGHFTWTSPLNRTYHTQPPPITHDLPDPLPRPVEPGSDPSLRLRYEGPILERLPPRPDPPPPPDPDEPPPF
ncbi:MAG TPA: DUF222 domain-containing protein [Pseudonocardiaceae bacterium]|nr:DUF222 domain-containing protein [Pseudonocardiaceae bacterium]